MNEKVEALNKVEELEHINLQLQSECDTIGGYDSTWNFVKSCFKTRLPHVVDAKISVDGVLR